MIRLPALLLIVLALAGCELPPVRTEIEPPKPLANVCDEACKTPCKSAKEVARWECPDPEDGECWKLQHEQVINPLVTLADQCEVKRQACLDCIERADTARATCGTVVECGKE